MGKQSENSTTINRIKDAIVKSGNGGSGNKPDGAAEKCNDAAQSPTSRQSGKKRSTRKKVSAKRISEARVLTDKQERFIEEYLVDLDSKQACIRAGYSKRSASPQSQKLLSMPKIRSAITIAKKLRAHRTSLNTDAILRELAVVGFSRMSDFADWNENGVRLKESGLIPPELLAAVSEVKEGPHGLGIKLHSKIEALKMLGNHLDIFSGEHTAPGVEVNVNILNAENLKNSISGKLKKIAAGEVLQIETETSEES